MFKGIIAIDSNRTMGFENGIPWPREKGDLKFFKECTWGGNVIMGRKTFEGLNRVWLHNRHIYVLTNFNKYGWNNSEAKGVEGKTVTTIITNAANLPNADFWVCGGKSIYELFIPKISQWFVTYIKGSYKGDCVMPEFESQFPNQKLIQENENFRTVWYWRAII